MPLPKLLAISIACAVSGAAIGANPAPPPWANAGDESGRAADTRTTAAPQEPNASSRGAAAAPARAARSRSSQSEASNSPRSAQAQSAHSTAQAASGDTARRTPSSTKSQSGEAQSAAAGASGAGKSEQTGDPAASPESGASAPSNAWRGRDWGWLGLLGLFGLLGLLYRRRYERHTEPVVTRPVNEPARGVRVYETPDPVARP
jgi:cobalamin biosynthesis Mg chelatase CobN